MKRTRKPPAKSKYKKHNTKRNSACRGKTRFRDEREAHRALHLIQNSNSRAKIPVRAYHCADCKGVHLTSVHYNVYPEPDPDMR